ncbi:MAG: hypothetical protein HYR77_01470 [Ignavibacteria bacterium]|nr:hypothetical protein [Ignavibacteria bacterium]
MRNFIGLVNVGRTGHLPLWRQVIEFSHFSLRQVEGGMPARSWKPRATIAAMLRTFTLLAVLTYPGRAFSFGEHSPRSISCKEVLELGAKDNFIKVEEIVSDSSGDIFVTDSYQYSIKKFDSRGFLVQAFGKRGKTASDFKSFPYKIQCWADTLALVELGSSDIHFFTPEFTSAGITSVGGPIVDIAFNTLGQIYASMIPFSHRKEDIVILYDKSGRILSRVPLTQARGEPAFDMIHLAVDSSDNLLIAYRYVNNITIYDNRQRIKSSFRIRGLPDESPSEKSAHTELGSLPTGNIIQDVSIDRRGNIFVLCGDYAKHPQRDVFVYDYRGNPVTNLTLPDKTGILFIDSHGYLYTREKQRSVVKKYRLTYVNF